MSQYATTTDLQNLAITAAAATRFGSVAMNAQLQAASSLADGYIGGLFPLPLQVSPQGWDMSLTRAVCNIAAKFLYDQFGYNPGAPVDELIQRRYNEAIDFLVLVRDKRIEPQWVPDPILSASQADPAGDFAVTDLPVGLTSRGTVDNSDHSFGDATSLFWNGW